MRRRRIIFFSGAFLFALIALVPLRLALGWLGLGERGLAAREATGSVWLGGLSEVQFGPVAVGDVSARLRTLPLLVGRARMDVERRGDAVPLEGAATVTRHGFGVDDVTARVDVAGLPVAVLDLNDVSVRFSNGVCRSAEGVVKAELPGASGLTGNARCAGGALLLPLASPGGERLDLRLFEDGRYRAEGLVGGVPIALDGAL